MVEWLGRRPPETDVGPRLGFPGFLALGETKGGGHGKKTRKGGLGAILEVSGGMGWSGAGEPGLGCVLREISDVSGPEIGLDGI